MRSETHSIKGIADKSPLTWLDFALIAAITFAVFTPVLFSQFSPLDDYSMLLNNKQITEPSFEHLKEIWSTPNFRIYMPLPLTIWQLLSAATTKSGGTLIDWCFKLTSILFHCLAAVSAAWTLSIVTRTRWPAMAGALVFALHPFQVEAVAWTTGLKDVLCGLFAILSIGSYARFARNDPDFHWKHFWWWTALVAAIFSMLSKPTGMMLPFILIGVDFFARQSALSKRLASLLPLFVPAGLCGMVIFSVQGEVRVPRVATYYQPLIAIDAYSFYLRKLVWPVGVCIDYARSPVRIIKTWALVWTWIIPVLALVGVVLSRSRIVWLAAAIFVIPVLPTSGLVPFDMQQYSTVADHYMYLPMLGVGLLVAWIISSKSEMANGVILAGILACVALSWRYACQWETPGSLFGYALSCSPTSWMARSFMGDYAHMKGDNISGLRLTGQAIEINPEAGTAWDVRSRIEVEIGQYRKAADDALKGLPHMIDPLPAAKRVTILGAALNDRELAKKGVLAWIKADPESPVPRKIMQDIRRAEAYEAATRPAKSSS